MSHVEIFILTFVGITAAIYGFAYLSVSKGLEEDKKLRNERLEKIEMDLNEELKRPRSYLSIATMDGSTFNTELFEPYSYRTRTYASYTPSSSARHDLVSSRRAAEDEIDASKKRGYIEANGTYIPWTNIKSIQVRSE